MDTYLQDGYRPYLTTASAHDAIPHLPWMEESPQGEETTGRKTARESEGSERESWWIRTCWGCHLDCFPPGSSLGSPAIGICWDLGIEGAPVPGDLSIATPSHLGPPSPRNLHRIPSPWVPLLTSLDHIFSGGA
ncbi:hypothetical protein GDO86_014769 [Hymenochirus boettgeri]|uniref:Uncharacterized protein n=1 Tax=Hymenochirus boettgeri TaxID=247094 RepID=A0A8T2JV96_9PIPI|nr:hypothetical protein GDO86_014769 [Hymenochirus boettgeri]